VHGARSELLPLARPEMPQGRHRRINHGAAWALIDAVVIGLGCREAFDETVDLTCR
jgi:hypothetical protein